MEQATTRLYALCDAGIHQTPMSQIPLSRYRTKTKRGKWNSAGKKILKKIIDEHPELYLDEIQETFF